CLTSDTSPPGSRRPEPTRRRQPGKGAQCSGENTRRVPVNSKSAFVAQPVLIAVTIACPDCGPHRGRNVMIRLKNVVVATDFSEPSNAALDYGRELARAFGATLRVVHVVENVLATTVGVDGYFANLPEMQDEIDESASDTSCG